MHVHLSIQGSNYSNSLLACQSLDINSFETSVNKRVDPLTLEDLYEYLLVHELRIGENQSSINLSLASVNVAKPPKPDHSLKSPVLLASIQNSVHNLKIISWVMG